jgi:hypothetical protein
MIRIEETKANELAWELKELKEDFQKLAQKLKLAPIEIPVRELNVRKTFT